MSLPPISDNDNSLPQPPMGHGNSELESALVALRQGGVVAIPTDTLYGLAASVLDDRALERVFDIKGRPADLALPVLVSSWNQVARVADVGCSCLARLVQPFWPGSLTLVLPRAPQLSGLVTGGRDTVAVRMPNHWVPLRLADALGCPITGTSANASGQPNLGSAREIKETLGGRLDGIVDLAPPPAGLQSTIIDVTGSSPVLLREGATPFAAVQAVWERIIGPGDGNGGEVAN